MARLDLDYASKHLSEPFEPSPDDQTVVNDVEVIQRSTGLKARVEQTTGPLSTQSPPNGVGRYDTSLTVDAYAQEQLEHIASWIKSLGTFDAERYPRVHVNLARHTSLIADVMAIDTQDRIVIANPPAWLPPEDIDLLAEGYLETLAPRGWDLIFNTTPGGIYTGVGRWDTVASVLKTAVNSTATSFDVATTSGPLWTEADAQDGFDWELAGEQVTVTDLAPSLITYGAVGGAAHADNANVTPGLPAGLAEFNLMLALVAIRNSGTGVPDTHADWVRTPAFPAASNVQLFARIAGGSEAAPTFTFTGGVAGATTSAQIIRLPGKWHSASNIVIGRADCLNASAQDITFPGLAKPEADNCIVLALAWKQDDYTSVAALAGMTEIADISSALGDDQGLVWDYVIQTTAAAIAAGTFVVTGGAAAISRGALVALRCDYQTATVIRSVNGVVKAQVGAEPISLWTPMRWGL